jgi:DNA-binding response OmpR family regulator
LKTEVNDMNTASLSRAKLLLVEDDPSLGFVIKDMLLQRNFDVTLCGDGEQGEKMFSEKKFNVCILDVMLPKKDGFSLARAIRKINQDVPILFLTAKSMTDDKLEGFKTGADDYITKPFNLEELLCRIEVFLRRRNTTSTGTEENIFSIGQFQFDYKNLTLKSSNQEKVLNKK